MSPRAARTLLIALAAAAFPSCTSQPGRREEVAPMPEMKPACLRCEAPTPPDAEAYACGHECTFCARCTEEMERVCPNCGGELLLRPKRH